MTSRFDAFWTFGIQVDMELNVHLEVQHHRTHPRIPKEISSPAARNSLAIYQILSPKLRNRESIVFFLLVVRYWYLRIRTSNACHLNEWTKQEQDNTGLKLTILRIFMSFYAAQIRPTRFAYFSACTIWSKKARPGQVEGAHVSGQHIAGPGQWLVH